MKIVRYELGGRVRPGAVVGDAIVDIGDRWPSVLELVRGGSSALDALASYVTRNSPSVALADVKLAAPIERPGKYLAIGMNYRKHLEEAERLGVAAPQKQLWFNKQTSCIAGPFDQIEPGVTQMLDYEVELALIIGSRAKSVKASDALSHVFGYVVANDVSARDWQRHTPTFTMGKSFDTHGPIGPWIVTVDEIADPQALALHCAVNGVERQSSNTRFMIYGIAEQIEYLSTAFTLEPGDLLATGTPEGVGIAMEPPSFLNPGDVVRCEVEGIGAIENRVAG